MSTVYLVSVVVHILAAMLWVGGMGIFALVVVPVARRTLGATEATLLLRGVGARFATVGWRVLSILLVTGVLNLHGRGLLPALATTQLWSSPFGRVLAAKLCVVGLVALSSLAHGRDARGAGRARASHLGRAVLMLSVAVVVLAVLLVRGTPW